MAKLPDLGSLVEAIDNLCHADPSTLADGSTVVLLLAQLERLSAVATRAIGAFDRSADWAAAGARTPTAWLAVESRLPKHALRRRLALARDLTSLPEAESAWVAGSIGEAHVAQLAAARTPAREAAMARDEAMLVDWAQTLRYDQFVRTVGYWRQLNDDAGEDALAARDREARRVHLSPGLRGCGFLDGMLDPIGFAVFGDVLERIEHELFEADWSEARRRLGRDPTTLDLPRTRRQRRHDALIEMARRAAATPADGQKPRPLFTVLVDYQTLSGRVCELADGTVVTPGALVPWLTEADVERAVFGPHNLPINLGARRRLFTGATRRAVLLRDRECFHRYCDTPAHRCQVDHVQPWSSGGPTVDSNGRCACGFHNRLRHRAREPAEEPPGRDERAA